MKLRNKLKSQFAFRSANVTATGGVMKNVSLIQTGEAKGHGVYVDAKSLESALEVIGKKVPAYLTHEGALESDRILQQVGYFSGFYILEDRLMAEKFTALNSFQNDEPEKFNRLFDIADEIPETFGISLVFENRLFWVLEDGEEIPYNDEEMPKNAKYGMPVVRFVEIKSADFVDAPACNEEGLFQELKKPTSKIMSKEEIIEELEEEIVAEEEVQAAEPEAEESPEAEEEEEESTEAKEGEDAVSVNAEADTALDLIAEVATEVREVCKKVEKLEGALEEQKAVLTQLATKSKLGTSPKALSTPAEKTESLRDQFMNTSGPELVQFYQKNRSELAKSL